MILKKKYDYQYTNESFLEEKITKRDIQFTRDISEDDLNWNLIYNNGEIFSYFSKENYLDTCSFFDKSTSTKFNLIIPYSLNEVLIKILPRYEDKKISEGFVKSYKYIKYVKETKDNPSYCIVKVYNDLKYPFDLRVSKMIISYYYDEKEKSVYFIFKPFLSAKDFKLLSENECFVKDDIKYCFLMNYYVQKFEYLDTNTTIFTSTHIVKFNGWTKKFNFLNKSIVKLLSKKIKNTFISNIENSKRTLVECREELENDGVGKLVIECIEKMNKMKCYNDEENTIEIIERN
jgi:hypothetical protein